jgi:hypothetical protein
MRTANEYRPLISRLTRVDLLVPLANHTRSIAHSGSTQRLVTGPKTQLCEPLDLEWMLRSMGPQSHRVTPRWPDHQWFT